jgi:hypothetical protein
MPKRGRRSGEPDAIDVMGFTPVTDSLRLLGPRLRRLTVARNVAVPFRVS